MSKAVILSKNGETVYPATIPAAIIDPQTGLPLQFGLDYTINNQDADENGNFTITCGDLGAAPESHTHELSDISGLETTLTSKSDVGHTHDMVTGLQVNDTLLTGFIQISGANNVVVSQSNNNIDIKLTPYTTDITESLLDLNNNEYKIFVGTQMEWDGIKDSLPNNTEYLVFIRS